MRLRWELGDGARRDNGRAGKSDYRGPGCLVDHYAPAPAPRAALDAPREASGGGGGGGGGVGEDEEEEEEEDVTRRFRHRASFRSTPIFPSFSKREVREPCGCWVREPGAGAAEKRKRAPPLDAAAADEKEFRTEVQVRVFRRQRASPAADRCCHGGSDGGHDGVLVNMAITVGSLETGCRPQPEHYVLTIKDPAHIFHSHYTFRCSPFHIRAGRDAGTEGESPARGARSPESHRKFVIKLLRAARRSGGGGADAGLADLIVKFEIDDPVGDGGDGEEEEYEKAGGRGQGRLTFVERRAGRKVFEVLAVDFASSAWEGVKKDICADLAWLTEDHRTASRSFARLQASLSEHAPHLLLPRFDLYGLENKSWVSGLFDKAGVPWSVKEMRKSRRKRAWSPRKGPADDGDDDDGTGRRDIVYARTITVQVAADCRGASERIPPQTKTFDVRIIAEGADGCGRDTFRITLGPAAPLSSEGGNPKRPSERFADVFENHYTSEPITDEVVRRRANVGPSRHAAAAAAAGVEAAGGCRTFRRRGGGGSVVEFVGGECLDWCLAEDERRRRRQRARKDGSRPVHHAALEIRASSPPVPRAASSSSSPSAESAAAAAAIRSLYQPGEPRGGPRTGTLRFLAHSEFRPPDVLEVFSVRVRESRDARVREEVQRRYTRLKEEAERARARSAALLDNVRRKAPAVFAWVKE